MKLPEAYLFDMDGTLCHTEPLHFAALRQTLRENGEALDIRLFESQLAGQTTANVFETLFPELSERERRILVGRKEKLFRELASELTPTPGVADFIDWADRSGTAIALVTNAPRVDVEFILRVLDMPKRFDIVIVASEMPHPKPHPMPYLRALEACNVRASAAVAFEDSFAGVMSATTAGIQTVGITTTLSSEVLLRAGVSRTVVDFQDAKLKSLSLALAPDLGRSQRSA